MLGMLRLKEAFTGLSEMLSFRQSYEIIEATKIEKKPKTIMDNDAKRIEIEMKPWPLRLILCLKGRGEKGREIKSFPLFG